MWPARHPKPRAAGVQEPITGRDRGHRSVRETQAPPGFLTGIRARLRASRQPCADVLSRAAGRVDRLGDAEPERRQHRGGVRYVVEQNVTVEADDPVQARSSPATRRAGWPRTSRCACPRSPCPRPVVGCAETGRSLAHPPDPALSHWATHDARGWGRLDARAQKQRNRRVIACDAEPGGRPWSVAGLAPAYRCHRSWSRSEANGDRPRLNDLEAVADALDVHGGSTRASQTGAAVTRTTSRAIGSPDVPSVRATAPRRASRPPMDAGKFQVVSRYKTIADKHVPTCP